MGELIVILSALAVVGCAALVSVDCYEAWLIWRDQRRSGW